MTPSKPPAPDAGQFQDLAPHYDELMVSVPYDDWADYVRLLWHFSDHEPRRVLDCACGTGNVAFALAKGGLELAKGGLEVVGVDLSHSMIEVAQQKAQVMQLPARFLQADLTNFALNERFDSATCLYDSLNYILDAGDLQRAFACIGKHIKPDGVWVFDMNSDYALRADLFTQRNRDPFKGLHYDWHADYDAASRICTVQMRFERPNGAGAKQVFHETHRERAYLIPEVEAMLQATGWNLLHTFDAYTLNRPHGQSERWFFVARREDE